MAPGVVWSLLACLSVAALFVGGSKYGEEERLIGWKGETYRGEGARETQLNVSDRLVTLPSGWRMPCVGFGTAGLGPRTREAVASALEAGYTLLDSAQAREWYREDLVGAAVRDAGTPRHTLFLTSKVHPRHLGFDATAARVDVSLRELGTHYLDLMLLHYPECWGDLCGGGVQPAGTWRDSWRALEAAHRAGTIRSLGVSNFDARQVTELLAFASVKPSVVQANSDPYAANAELQELCGKHGIVFVAYSTLGTQWWGRGYHANNPVLTAPAVVDAAAAHGVSPAQAVLRWALHKGQCVIPRSGDAAHMAANRRLDFELTEEEVARIDALDGTLPPHAEHRRRRLSRRRACAAAAMSWPPAALPWRTGRGACAGLERPRVLAHATQGDEDAPALKFLRQLQGKLPVIGLVSRLTAPGGGFDVRLSFGEYCRRQVEDEAKGDFNVAVVELSRNRKLNSRAVMLVCWMISQGGGIVPDDLIKSAALRAGSRNSDLEYEVYRFEETLDAALQRRQRLRDGAPPLLTRGQLSPLAVQCVRALLRLGPDEVLAGEDAQYLQVIVNQW